MLPDLSAHQISLHQIDVGNRLQNYIYLLHDEALDITAVVDPTEAGLVLDYCAEHGWGVDYILSTHHHADHVGGNLELKAQTDCVIIGYLHDARRIPGIDLKVEEGQKITIGRHQAEILFLPGHTLGHIGYYFEALNILFSGDVLFSGGCGRVFEGTAGQMLKSLRRLMALPDHTTLCSAHEYTENNLEFARQVEPHNMELLDWQHQVMRLRAEGKPTVPTLLGDEKRYNPFLRCATKALEEAVDLPGSSEVERFAHIRQLKDAF